MKDIIRTTDLCKDFGQLKAVNRVNLHLEKGEIYGFLGLNGAGKTTSIRMLLGMIKPTAGDIFLFGKKLKGKNRPNWNRIGYMVETPAAYPELSVEENLMGMAKLRGLKGSVPVRNIMQLLHLERYSQVKARNLSLGNAQRLGIAKAMMHQPELLILDEPANGLDPAGIVQVRELMLDLALNRGVSIFVSSHILGEISRFATRIGIIHEGRMIHEADSLNFERERKKKLLIKTGDNESAYKILSKEIKEIKVTAPYLETTSQKALNNPDQISELLVSYNLPPMEIKMEAEDLEHYFLNLIKTKAS